MEWLIAGVGLVLLVVLALAMESTRSGELGDDAHSLALLGKIRSPMGKRFYPTGEAALELSDELDGVRDPRAAPH